MVEHWIRAAAPHAVVRAAASRGVDGAELLKRAQVRLPNDPTHTVSLSTHFAVWDAAMRLVDDPSFPIDVGCSMQHEDFDVLGYAASTAADLERALYIAQRFGPLYATDTTFVLEPEADALRAVLPPSGPLPLAARAATEAIMVQTLELGRSLAGVAFRPLEVRFRHRQPSNVQRHRAFFGCKLTFEADRASMLFSSEDLARPTKTGDAKLHRILLREAERALDELPSQVDFTGRVRKEVERALAGGAPSAEMVARRLGCSIRTLRRRLDEEGSSFRQLTDEVRFALARRFLEIDRLSVDEVALLVGFSDGRAFRRAYRRWTGRPPSAG